MIKNLEKIDERDLATGDAPGPEISDELMQPLLDYYVKLHEVVQKKLGHAKTATQHGLEKFTADDGSDLPQKLAELDQLWNEILEMFREAGLSTQDLEEIEKTLMLIPNAIRAHYEDLIERDRALRALIDEITSRDYLEAYEHARRITKKLQSAPNLMSGLKPDDYEQGWDIGVKPAAPKAGDEADDEENAPCRAFKIVRSDKQDT